MHKHMLLNTSAFGLRALMPAPSPIPEGGGSGGDAQPGAASVLGVEGVQDAPAVGADAPWSGDDTWKVGEGDAAQDWYELIPEEKVREGIKAKGYKNPAELAVAYSNLMAKQRNPDTTVTIPGEDATDDERAAFRKAYGVPETADAYVIEPAEGVEHDPQVVGFLRETAHKLGMNQEQAAGLAQEWDGFIAGVEAEQAEARNAAVAEVKEKYGDELPKIQAAGQRAVKALGLSDATIADLDSNLGTAGVVELLAAIGAKGGEAAFKGTGAGGAGDVDDVSNLSKAQAQEKIDTLMGDTKFQEKYQNKDHPEHQQAVKRMERLFAAT